MKTAIYTLTSELHNEKAVDPSQVSYFLTNPIGNHHIVIPGHIGSILEEVLK